MANSRGPRTWRLAGGVHRDELLELGTKLEDISGTDHAALSAAVTSKSRFVGDLQAPPQPGETVDHALPWRLKSGDMFDEEAARVEVLQSKPTCFLVLGEPGSEARHLARSVADHWGCIAISPDDVLSSELEQQSDVAAHVRNRLRGGHAVPPDVVWALVELAVHSGEVQHRGYVLSGVPLTPLGDAPPSVEEQMESIFGWSMKPDILICITCPHEDIAYKRSELKYDFHLGKEIDGMIEADSTIKVIYIRRRSAEEDQIQYKHLVRLTHNFPHSVMTELSDYKHNIQPTIDIYIDSYPPDRVVRLDGRASYRHMFNCVKEILNVFPLNRVYRVHSMMRKHHVVEHSDESEYLENEEEGFQNQSIHESIPMFVIKDMISSKFQWRISRWGTTCPVSLFEGSAKEGNVEHAVRFMDKLFFLYSALEQDKFTKNPRLYISPPAPRPTGKFVIIGPALSGKTTISRFVAEIFSCKLLNVDEIRQVLKENELKKILTNEAREKLRGQLEKEWNEEEKSRLENIQNWKNMIVVHLEKLKDYSQRQQMPSSENETHSETPEGYPKDTENSENFSEESNIIESRDVLKKFGFPLEDDMKFAVGILNDPELLTDYIPEHLMTETPFVEHTDENDSFIANYVNSAIHKMKYEELEVPPDAVAAKILEAIQEAEQEKLTATHGYVKEGGWIFDEFPLLAGVWNLLEENNRLPDHIVCLTDDDPDEISLRDKWENMDPKSRSKFMYKSADGPFLTESTMLQATEDETSEHEVETSRELHSFSEFVDHYHHLGHNFSEEWKNFINLVNVQQKYIEISISGRSIEQVKADVIKFVEFQFIEKPSEISEDYGLDEAPSQLELNETELESDNFSVDDNEISKRSINMRYRMGDTGINCPVVFKKYWVLWPGSDNFAVNYMGNAFLLSSETALEEFKQNPHHYGCHYKPFIDLPPPRICIIGTIGSGKSDIRNFLAKHLVLSHFDYHDLIKEVLLPTDVLKIVRKPDRPIDESIQETYPEDVTAIREYLLSLAPLPEEMLDRLLPKFWHSLPHKENGFILEGFPHQEKDVEFMKSRVLIPDIVIELQADVRNTKKRLQSTYFNTWLEEMTKTKSDWYTQLHESRERWQRMRGERRQELYRGRHGGAANEDGRENGSLEEVEKEDIDEVELLLDEELPEPPATPPEWETAQEATDRILEQIESWFEIDRENMEVLKELARQANIPWSTVSADRRPALVRREVLHVVQSLARKQSGVLYRPVPLTAEQAESLLECGYLLPSQFSRHCPVRLHEGASLDETVVSWNLRQQPVPVAFKGRVFFLSDDRSFNLFCADPIRFMDQEIPTRVWRELRLAVLGAPKSGKTTLAGRLAGHYGLTVATLGQAARHVLQQLPWTRLARDCSSWLREGATLPGNLAADCLQLYLHLSRSLARGFVLDGYPQSLEQISELERRSLQPHLVILLEVDWQFSVEAAAAISTHRWDGRPAHPEQLLEQRWSSWIPALEQVEEALQQRFQNVVRLDGRRSAAYTSRRAQEAVFQVLECLQQSWSSSPVPRRLRWSGITPELFARRQSKFQHYCCLCYVLAGELTSSSLEPPPDRTGLLEWRGQCYWLCDQHLLHFLAHSERYSQLLDDAHFVEHLPSPLTLSDRPDYAVAAGRCLVTYWDSLPSRVVRDGSHEFAVDYRGRTYLFCSAECLRRFCATPLTYWDRQIPEIACSEMPEVRGEALPTTGYLEQTLYEVLQDGITAVGVERPKYPGMSAVGSACTALALRLKVANPLASQESRRTYGDVLRQFESRCRDLVSASSRLKMSANPQCRRSSSHARPHRSSPAGLQ